MILHWIQRMTAIICTTDVVVQSRYVHRRHQLPKIRRPNNWQCASETYTQRPNNWYQEPEIYTSDQKLALTRWADKSHTWSSIASNSYPLSALHFKLLTKETCQIHIHSDPITNNRSQKYIYIYQPRNSRLLVEPINHILGTVWRHIVVNSGHSISNYWQVNKP